jgi:hypothetical protein
MRAAFAAEAEADESDADDDEPDVSNAAEPYVYSFGMRQSRLQGHPTAPVVARKYHQQTVSNVEHADPVLDRLPSLGYQYMTVVEQHRLKDKSQIAVEVSPRLHDEIAHQEDELLAAIEEQFHAYKLGPKQTLVYRWPVGRRSGGEVMLAVMMEMPNNCIRVGYEDDFDWDAVAQQGVPLGGCQTVADFNNRLRQLRRPN